MQRRLIVPVILHCQCVDEVLSEESLRDISRSPFSQVFSDVSLHHRVLSVHTVSSGLLPVEEARVPESGALRNSIYTPVSARMDDGAHFAAVPLLTSESSTSLSSEIRNYELMERKTLFARCLPLMKDHYCVDEICYKLDISHASFWRMVEDLSDHFCVFYVIPDLWRVCWCVRGCVSGCDPTMPSNNAIKQCHPTMPSNNAIKQCHPTMQSNNWISYNKQLTPKDGKRGWNRRDSRGSA